MTLGSLIAQALIGGGSTLAGVLGKDLWGWWQERRRRKEEQAADYAELERYRDEALAAKRAAESKPDE